MLTLILLPVLLIALAVALWLLLRDPTPPSPGGRHRINPKPNPYETPVDDEHPADDD
jgi:hypothetical protein